MQKLEIRYDDGANLYAVLDAEQFVLECFDTEDQAVNFAADFEALSPETSGGREALQQKHGALFRVA